MRYDPRQLMGAFNRLAPRERLMIGIVIPVVILIAGYSLVWDPLQVSAELLTRKITTREKDLAAIERLHDEYLDLAKRIEAGQGGTEVDAGFNLLATLQPVIYQAVPRDRITSMNPSQREVTPEFKEESVEIKLAQVNLQQIVDLVYRVEKGDHPLHFSRIAVKKRFNDVHNFDVVATVSVLKAIDRPAEKPADKPAERSAERGPGHGGGA